MRQIHIAPNSPLYVALVDPEGQYDFELRTGRYQTTTGDILHLPRPAVILLNALEPQPGEEIQITKHWSGKPGDSPQWTVCLSTRSENARAEAEKDSQDLVPALRASIEAAEAKKTPVAAPMPIRGPRKQPKPAEQQPRLFDRRGTGTDGPAAAPMPFIPPAPRPYRPHVEPIPANIAVREILAFIAADPNTQNWSDQARQDLASTIIIAAYKAGQVGLWERNQ